MRQLTVTRFSLLENAYHTAADTGEDKEGGMSKTAHVETHFFLGHAGNIMYVLIYRRLKRDPWNCIVLFLKLFQM